MKYTLVIIDMQVGYAASRHRGLRGNIKIEIRKALKNNCDIVFMTFGSTPIISSLSEIALKSPQRFHLVNKIGISGAKEFNELRMRIGLQFPIKICGVQTDCCVLATVRELTEIIPNNPIEVLEKCCASFVSPLNYRVNESAQQLHDKSIKQMSEMPNVKIV